MKSMRHPSSCRRGAKPSILAKLYREREEEGPGVVVAPAHAKLGGDR